MLGGKLEYLEGCARRISTHKAYQTAQQSILHAAHIKLYLSAL